MKRFLVYFFGTDFDRVKIGTCQSNLYRRQKDIQTGCPDSIKLLGIIQCKNKAEMKRRETELHRQFEDYNTIGEWFRIDPEISTYIQEFAESGKDIMNQDYQRNCEDRRKQKRSREYKRENRGNTREYQREYYQRNREDRREYQREYRQRPEVRERERKRNRECYRNSSEVREKAT